MTPSLKDSFASSLVGIDVNLALNSFYLGTAAAILFAYKIPLLKDRFLTYGARRPLNKMESHATSRDLKSNENLTNLLCAFGPLIPFFDFIATLQVPHSWFMSFYSISVASSVLWAFQLLTHGSLYQKIADRTQHQDASMSLNRIALCWFLMAFQGTRRLWECLVLTKPSQSTMWIFHWLAGVLFYIATGVSIWIQGVRALESTDWTLVNFQITTPSLRVVVFLPTFLLASVLQYEIHVHLASLQKYTIPFHTAFHRIICPHYTAECVLYFALTFLAAPQGRLVNGNMLSATIFVIVNLGVTADISKTWAVEKFGKEKMGRKWRMLPGLW